MMEMITPGWPCSTTLKPKPSIMERQYSIMFLNPPGLYGEVNRLMCGISCLNKYSSWRTSSELGGMKVENIGYVNVSLFPMSAGMISLMVANKHYAMLPTCIGHWSATPFCEHGHRAGPRWMYVVCKLDYCLYIGRLSPWGVLTNIPPNYTNRFYVQNKQSCGFINTQWYSPKLVLNQYLPASNVMLYWFTRIPGHAIIHNY